MRQFPNGTALTVRIWITSDLHTDASAWSPQVPTHDVMVVAGDIADGPSATAAELTRIQAATTKPIIFVPGNHDFCGGRLLPGEFSHANSSISILERGGSVIIDGVRFIGATLWTDFGLTDSEFASQRWAISAMPEYETVRHGSEDRLIWPIDTANAHAEDRSALELALSRPHSGPTVVITHHAPSLQSVSGSDRRDTSSAAFASNLEPVIHQHRPALWIHGHIHEPTDYSIGSTRVIANPRGYSRLRTTPWRDDLVVDIPFDVNASEVLC